jgi:hypothetical protein
VFDMVHDRADYRAKRLLAVAAVVDNKCRPLAD